MEYDNHPIDSFYGLPVGIAVNNRIDVIVSVVEDWIEMYKAIYRMKSM